MARRLALDRGGVGQTGRSRGRGPNSYPQTLKERTHGLPHRLSRRLGVPMRTSPWDCRGNTNPKARLTTLPPAASSINAARGQAHDPPRPKNGMGREFGPRVTPSSRVVCGWQCRRSSIHGRDRAPDGSPPDSRTSWSGMTSTRPLFIEELLWKPREDEKTPERGGRRNFWLATDSPTGTHLRQTAGINPIAATGTDRRRPAVAVFITPAGGHRLPWLDEVDLETGFIRYFGDNKPELRRPAEESPGNKSASG